MNTVWKEGEMLDFKFKHTKTGEEKIVNFTEKEIRDLIEEEAYDKVQECDCEPIGETNVIECNCIDYLEHFELIR